MPTYSVNISWKDRLNQASGNSFEVNDPASAMTLAINLKNFTNAGIKGITISEKKLPSEIIAASAGAMTPDPAAEYGTVDQKAVCSFLDPDGGSHTWEIPAPIDGMFEEIPMLGKRITKAYGDQISVVLSNELGISLTFTEGWFKSDK
jgi:hypothetical protein